MKPEMFACTLVGSLSVVNVRCEAAEGGCIKAEMLAYTLGGSF